MAASSSSSSLSKQRMPTAAYHLSMCFDILETKHSYQHVLKKCHAGLNFQLGMKKMTYSRFCLFGSPEANGESLLLQAAHYMTYTTKERASFFVYKSGSASQKQLDWQVLHPVNGNDDALDRIRLTAFESAAELHLLIAGIGELAVDQLPHSIFVDLSSVHKWNSSEADLHSLCKTLALLQNSSDYCSKMLSSRNTPLSTCQVWVSFGFEERKLADLFQRWEIQPFYLEPDENRKGSFVATDTNNNVNFHYAVDQTKKQLQLLDITTPFCS